jgi:hypothetical protein
MAPPTARQSRFRPVSEAATLIFLGLFLACGGNPTGPTPPGPSPTVTAVTPNTGSTLGGTSVTITGSNFSGGATVTFGGVAATSSQVVSSTQLTATTAQHAAGDVDVAVAVGTQRGTLASAFTYVAPSQTPNASPTIQSVQAQGSRPDEPAQFADLNEEISVTATVKDAESSPDALTYEWSADLGTVTGTGRTVKWRAPAAATTPAKATIALAVVETYQTTSDAGLPVTVENRVTKTVTVNVHDSAKEVGDMATEFLTNFSKSEVSVGTVMKDFTPSCSGTADERQDVEDNREDFTIVSYSVGPPSVTIDFDGRCAFRNRPGDACSASRVQWSSIQKSNGDTGTAKGIDHVAAVYLSGRWWLCSSDFEGQSTLGPRFVR